MDRPPRDGKQGGSKLGVGAEGALPGLSPQCGAAKPQSHRSGLTFRDFSAGDCLSAWSQTGPCVFLRPAVRTLPRRCAGSGSLPAPAAPQSARSGKAVALLSSAGLQSQEGTLQGQMGWSLRLPRS